MKRGVLTVLLAIAVLSPISRPTYAALPLLNIDGDGGGAIVPWAYLSNPTEERLFGMPSASAWTWWSDDYTFYFTGAALTVANRVEFGLAYQKADIDELRDDLRRDSELPLVAPR